MNMALIIIDKPYTHHGGCQENIPVTDMLAVSSCLWLDKLRIFLTIPKYILFYLTICIEVPTQLAPVTTKKAKAI